jgi:hypothetical protein
MGKRGPAPKEVNLSELEGILKCGMSNEAAASLAGFGSVDTLRRALKRQHGIGLDELRKKSIATTQYVLRAEAINAVVNDKTGKREKLRIFLLERLCGLTKKAIDSMAPTDDDGSLMQVLVRKNTPPPRRVVEATAVPIPAPEAKP